MRMNRSRLFHRASERSVHHWTRSSTSSPSTGISSPSRQPVAPRSSLRVSESPRRPAVDRRTDSILGRPSLTHMSAFDGDEGVRRTRAPSRRAGWRRYRLRPRGPTGTKRRQIIPGAETPARRLGQDMPTRP